MDAIALDLHPRKVYTYNDSVDEYGQMHRVSTESTVNMFIRNYKNREANDPVLGNASLIALSKELMSTTQDVVVDGVKYHVVYTIPSKRWNQAFLAVSR